MTGAIARITQCTYSGAAGLGGEAAEVVDASAGQVSLREATEPPARFRYGVLPPAYAKPLVATSASLDRLGQP